MVSARFSIAGTAMMAGAAFGALLLIASQGCSRDTLPDVDTEAPPETAATVPQPAPGPKPLWQQHIGELQPEVQAWARAWSNQDVEAYLSHYSPEFVPPNGMSREAWEAQRRQRLTRPSRVVVELSNFRRVGFSKSWTGNRQMELVKVRFHQTYESDTYSDDVGKELQLELVDMTWNIVTEMSL